MITLTEQEIVDLINFANEMPTKYGMPLITFFQSKKPLDKEDLEDSVEKHLED
jgi:hypothetical protein